MIALLVDTLVWTGVLIAAVLVLRRPVTRMFGAQAAYALWALPALRLILPPVVLPAGLAPRSAMPAPTPLPDPAVWPDAVNAPFAEPVPMQALPTDAVAPAGFDLFALVASWPLAEIVAAIWLGGAAVALTLRFSAYFSLRDRLLAEGRELGRAAGALGGAFGKVRLIETPATQAPLALGVIDPVIALPPGFLAQHDRTARDLALAHELAHHRAFDLLVNMAVQPLFALHWFNPLGRYGWLALRRDQEAACDARVMARHGASERAAYAALIARFAAAPGLAHPAALTAPMACPVLGEKSIIHRLRSLTMPEPTPHRRWAGRALLGAGLLALPLTASVTYAASEQPAAPEPAELPTPPVPANPLSPPSAAELPQPPAVVIFGDRVADATQVTERVWQGEDGKQRRVTMFTASGQGREDAADAPAVDSQRDTEQAARDQALAAMQQGLAEADRVRAQLPQIIAQAMASAEAARAAAAAMPRVIVKQECKSGSDEVSESTTRDGVQVISICQPRVFASARRGLEEARAEIARDKDIPEATRADVLRTLDSQIARWKDQEG